MLKEQSQENYDQLAQLLSRLPDVINNLRNADRFRQVHDILTILVIVHEEVVDFRLAKILKEEHPYLPQMDIEQLMENRRARHASIQELAAEFLDHRRRFLDMLLHISAESWERTGFHESEGHVTFRELVRRLNEKDQELVRQLTKLMKAATPAST